MRLTNFASTRSLTGKVSFWHLQQVEEGKIIGSAADVGAKGKIEITGYSEQIRLEVHRPTLLVVVDGVLIGDAGLPLSRLRASVLCENGKGAPLKKLRLELKGPADQPKQQKEWEEEYGKHRLEPRSDLHRRLRKCGALLQVRAHRSSCWLPRLEQLPPAASEASHAGGAPATAAPTPASNQLAPVQPRGS
ncbi:unnamed protein product [Closterium sp. Naga37s-1]|nr:unnamed protein product [Closterium sp. Naga37s-1]